MPTENPYKTIGFDVTQWLSTTQGQARSVLDSFRSEQREIQARQIGQVSGEVAKVSPRTPPAILTTTQQFEPRPFALAINPNGESSGSSNEMIPPPVGISAELTVCVDNGDDTFTEMTATFANGLLVSLA